MLAAHAGGFALGVAGTAAAHALQYPIGSLTHTSHGVGVGVLLPYVMRYNAPVRVAEFAEIGRLFGQSADSESALAGKGITAVDALLAQIGIPKSLADIGLSEDQLDTVAEQGLAARRLVQNNPRPLDFAAMQHIVEAAYRGDRTMPDLEEFLD
jgi:alcohol dehydrogenase class IV